MRLSRGLALAVWLGSGLVLSSAGSGTGFIQSGVAYASGCAPLAASSGNQKASHGFGTFTDMEKSFSDARAAEGCSTPLDLTSNQGISDATWSGYSPQQQMFVLYNAERQDRGLTTLTLDITLMSQIDVNHSHEMNQYSYFAHSSPINNPSNQPGDIFSRLLVNPAISNGWTNIGENIAGNSSAAAAVFEYMYDDANSTTPWGHRHNILGYSGGSFGAFNWVGIGVLTGSKYGMLFTSDFLQNSSYAPPATADTTAPTMSAPTVSGSPGGSVTASVSNVTDSGAGTGAAGLTGVVFYAGSGTNPFTVRATQNGTTWTANLDQPLGTTVHAVAVDGSGNYTDLPASSPTAARVTHLAVSRHGAQTMFRWSVAPNHQIAGFNLYAGAQRLNAHLIPSMQRTSFRYSTHWVGPGAFRLEIVMSTGEVVRVAAH